MTAPDLDTLRDLQRRVAAASGPDRDLANEICVTLTGGYAGAPDVSLDAAVALFDRVLPGWEMDTSSGNETIDELPWVNVFPKGQPFPAYLDTSAEAATLPWAIVSATISALISRAETAKAEG